MQNQHITENMLRWVDARTPWPDETPAEMIFGKAQAAANSLAENCSRSQSVLRIAGQSGSGKTSQVLAALLEVANRRGERPCVVGIRSFVPFHPHYESLPKDSSLRERTNGFCLKMLIAVLPLLLKKKVAVILDVTLLDSVFEKYVCGLLELYGYRASYHILAVPKRQSTLFVLKRFQESGRKVNAESAGYFNTMLPRSLKKLSIWHGGCHSTVWSAYEKQPVYTGSLSGSLEPFSQTRRTFKKPHYSAQELLEAKITFLEEQCPGTRGECTQYNPLPPFSTSP